MATNPLRLDPTRTIGIRRRFSTDLTRRFVKLKKKIVDLVVTQDAFGLAPKITPFTTNAQQWRFNTTPQQLELFQQWLSTQLQQEILTDETTTDDDWWYQYSYEGFKQGAGRVFDDYSKLGAIPQEKLPWYNGTKQEFLRSAFANPVGIDRIKLLAGRVFTELKGMTDAMAQSVSRTLTDGLVQGKSPREVAKLLSEAVDGISRKRALVIARTETIRAHAEGQLYSMERLGMEEVGVAVEWSTSGVGVTKAGNPSPCKLCAAMDGVVFSVQEAHGMIPRHPNCMCSFIPANVGESKKGQVRGQKEIQKAIKKSVEAGLPKSSKGLLAKLGLRNKTRWIGASNKISKERPTSILD